LPFFLIPIFVPAALGNRESGRVFLFIIDRVSWRELDVAQAKCDTIRLLIENGAVAALNTQTSGGISSAAAAVTLNAGTRSRCEPIFARAESPGTVLERNTANPANPEHRRATHVTLSPQVIVPDIARIKELNRPLVKSRPGELGRLLHLAQLRTAAIGCGDVFQPAEGVPLIPFPGSSGEAVVSSNHRPAALIAMDGDGDVDYGDVSSRWAVGDPAGRAFRKMDVHGSIKELDDVLQCPAVAFVVIDVGDTLRADEAARWVDAGKTGRYKRESLVTADGLLSAVVARMDRRTDQLIVISLTPPVTQDRQLCPVIAYGNGFPRGSLLKSLSTRRSGVVTLTDVSVSILYGIGLQPTAAMEGTPIVAQSFSGAEDYVLALVGRAHALDAGGRNACLGTLAFLGMGVLLWSWTVIRRESPAAGTDGSDPEPVRCVGRKRSALCVPQLALLFLPSAFFWGTDVVLRVGAPLGLALMVAGSLMVAVMVRALSASRPVAVMLASGTLLLSVILGLCAGADLSFNSLLGYSPFFGGRYYGLGNIGMILLISAALAFVGSSIASLRDGMAALPVSPSILAWVCVLFIGCLLLVGLPRLGANAGGFITAAAGFGVTVCLLMRLTLTRRRTVFLSVSVVGLVVALTWLGARSERDESHLSRLVADVGAFGGDALLSMVAKKAVVWGRSFRHLHWDLALGAVLLLLHQVWRMQRNDPRSALRRDPALTATVKGLLVAAIVGFFLNDSGPVIPAIAGFVGLPALLYIHYPLREM